MRKAERRCEVVLPPSHVKRKNMKRYLAICLAVLAAVACSDDDGPGTKPFQRQAPWESYTQAQLLKLKGAVRTVRQQSLFDGEPYLLLTASFDAAGRCLSYNPTGIDPQVATYDWGVNSIWYEYAYDASGRLTRVTKNEVGADPEIYGITYGNHNSYVPAPFPLGDIEPFLLKGVTRIESPNFLLTSDGTQAVAEKAGTGWGAANDRTTYVLENGMPRSAVTVSSRNEEEMSRTATTYTYDRNWLSRIEQTTVYPESDGSDTQVAVTEFSDKWPCTVTSREVCMGGSTEPEYRMVYTYGENGLPKSAEYVTGSFFEDEFRQHYNAYDAAGNWTSSTKSVSDSEIVITQELGYY